MGGGALWRRKKGSSMEQKEEPSKGRVSAEHASGINLSPWGALELPGLKARGQSV